MRGGVKSSWTALVYGGVLLGAGAGTNGETHVVV